MAEVIYLLCMLISIACAALLWRTYRASRNRLLLWCLLCFAGFALNNILLFVDEVLVDGDDLSTLRTAPAALGVLALVYGLIWERD